jgi:hypothetical protein
LRFSGRGGLEGGDAGARLGNARDLARKKMPLDSKCNLGSACIAVVIPSYKVITSISTVIERIGREVSRIYVVDDACPEKSGRYVEDNIQDARVKVLYNAHNLGVGERPSRV